MPSACAGGMAGQAIAGGDEAIVQKNANAVGGRAASHDTVYVDHYQGFEWYQQQRTDCVVGGNRALGSGQEGHP